MSENWYYYMHVETGEYVMTTWSQMDDYFAWVRVSRSEYEAANADHLPVLPGSPLDKRLQQPAAQQQPTGGESRTDIDAETITRWSTMFRNRATKPEWKDWYTDHAKNDMLDALDAIATLQADLADARARLAAAEADNELLLAIAKAVDHQAHSMGIRSLTQDVTDAWNNYVMELAAVRIEAQANGETAMQWKAMFEDQQRRADAIEAERARLRAALTDEDRLIEFANLCSRYPREARLTLFDRVFGDALAASGDAGEGGK